MTMGRFLVTGLGGSGKSKVCELLNESGLFALDGDDVPGLTRWQSAKTGQPIEVDHTKFVDYKKVDWAWQPEVLNEILALHPDLFLCGSASNEFDFFDKFDKTFVLTLEREKHESNLKSRSSSYGKDPKTIDSILSNQPGFVERAISLGALVIDANGSPEETVNQIITLSHDI